MHTQKLHLVLEGIREQYTKLLANNLVGIYVHGSIAFDCFNWSKSDIDYVVVVNEPLSLAEKQKLAEVTVFFNSQAPSKGLEMSVVLKEHCQNFVYPTPYELHFSNMHLKWWQNNPIDYCQKMNGSDADLAAHFTVIRHKGIVLCGEEISGVFSDVKPEYYFDSIEADIKNAKTDVADNPVCVVLNLCRVLAYKEDGVVLSKYEGGRWGMTKLPHVYKALIQTVLEIYSTDFEESVSIAENMADQFCDYMLDRIL